MKNAQSRRRFLALTTAAPLGAWPGMSLAAESAPQSLFDGQTLAGWQTIPRLYVPKTKAFAAMPSGDLKEAVFQYHTESPQEQARARAANHGIWTVEDGAIVGKQVPGSTDGSYLQSEATFGDFDLTVEARPDWPIDTGIMVRAHGVGTVGFQVLLDTRPDGCIGGVYGNGIGAFKAMPFLVSGDEIEGFRVADLRKSSADLGQFVPDGSASYQAFAAAWKPNDWNTVRIRCRGELPLIETWINGTPIVKLDTSTLGEKVPAFDPDRVKERLGRRGHIAFEVHDSHRSRDRWAPGAACRWRNITIQEL